MPQKKKTKPVNVGVSNAKEVRIEHQRAMTEFTILSENEENREVEVVFSTGQSGRRYDYWEDEYYLEELEVSEKAIVTDRLDKGLSVLDSHNRDSIHGVYGITGEYRIENGELIGMVRFAKDEQSELIYQKVKDKILRHVSLGYDVLEYTRTEPVGEMMKLLATSWQPTELSFVPVSFETTNGVRANERSEEKTTYNVTIIGDRKMNEEQLARLALLQNSQTRTADEEKELNTLLALQARHAETPVTQAPVIQAPVAQEESRSAPVAQAPVATHNRQADLDVMLKAVDSAGLGVDFATRHFSAGTTVDAFREAVISELAVKNQAERVAPTLQSDNRQDHAQGQIREAESAIMQRSGFQADGGKSFAGYSIFEIARALTVKDGNLGLSRHAVAERAFHSTSDFPMILANVMNKSLLGAYADVEQTFRDLGSKATVNDFREKHTYRLGDAPKLLPLGEGGEYKAGTFSESGEKYAISTFARKIGFTRNMLINDDMSALTQLPAMFGRAGAELESDIVWGLLLGYDFLNNKPMSVKMSDGKELYHAGHGNLLTGAGSAISKDALSELRKLGRKQKTIDGKFMNIRFNQLVAPEDIETELEMLLAQNYNATKQEDINPFAGKLQMRIEPRLSQVSTTAWLAFSNAIPTFEYATLAGEENMTTEMFTSRDIDGMQLNIRKDFGAGLIDWRGTAKATGA